MKILTFLFLTLFTLKSFAAIETLKVNTPVKSKEILDISKKSVFYFLDFSDGVFSGGLSGDLSEPTIVEITKDGSKVLKLKVTSLAKILIFENVSGNQVFDDVTNCETVLEKGANDEYSISSAVSSCNYDPKNDFFYNDVNPCCDGGPVVDSNMCFDSYEEGLAVCGEFDIDDYE